jgi:hypothetical protein
MRGGRGPHSGIEPVAVCQQEWWTVAAEFVKYGVLSVGADELVVAHGERGYAFCAGDALLGDRRLVGCGRRITRADSPN